MKIVVLDGYTLNPGDLSWQALAELGDLTVHDRTTYQENDLELVVARAADADVVFTNKTPLPAAALAAMPRLKFIGVLATGYNVVDVQAAKERGIVVANVPAYGTSAVAQMTIALLLELCNRVGAHHQAVQQGQWTNNADWCFWNGRLTELAGKTLGVIGFGRIGQATAQIARALGMYIVTPKRPARNQKNDDFVQYVDLEQLLACSDVITLHCPLSSATTGMINHGTIAKMKDGVMIVNTSRGPLIVEQHLADALKCGKVGGAAVDVVSTEPIDANNPLLTAPNCIITPHIAWAPREARQRLLEIAVANLRSFLEGNAVNVVNR